MTVYKSYNIIIKGQVQDVGFRNLVENTARSLNLRVMVYNDIDGTVKIVCRGASSTVKSLIDEIRSKSGNVGASIEGVKKEEIPGEVLLPPLFFKAPTDELSDISRKLDIGIESLQGIENNTNILAETSNSLVKGQDKVIKILGSIAQKLG